MRKIAFRVVSLVTCVAFVLSGCATMVNGRKQEIAIVSNPSDANVSVGNRELTTPTKVKLSRKSSHVAIVEKEGYEPAVVQINRRWSWWVLIDALWVYLVFIPIVYDLYTGGFYEFPEEFTVVLTPSSPVAQFHPTTHQREHGQQRPPTWSWDISVIPMVMPRLVSPFPTRLAVVPPPETIDSSFESWLDVALNFLQNRHPEIVIIERDALPPITEEVVMQHSGRVHGETAAHIGKLVGADTLLSYEVITLQSDAFQRVAKTGGEVTGSVEIRLLNVETGLTLFRQLATAMAQLPTPEEDQSWPDEVIHLAHGEAVTHAMSYALAALVAAFGDNPLGLVVNLTAPGKGVLIRGVLQGGPAHQAGLQQGDRILQINDYPISDWTVPVSLPARALVERAGEEQEFRLGNGL